MVSIVQAIRSEQSAASLIPELRDAHDFLAANGSEAIRRVNRLSDITSWGQSVKRVAVQLPQSNRPRLCADAPSHHSLTEVYNQCATIERLLDTLEWLESPGSGWAGSTVLVCHPTNTSGPSDGSDLDFDLAIRSANDEIGCFEISDVASSRDGNFKEGTDLSRFGVLSLVKRGMFEVTDIARSQLPGRCFLVVSEEFSSRLRRPGRHWLKGVDPPIRYEEVKDEGATRIFEVIVRKP